MAFLIFLTTYLAVPLGCYQLHQRVCRRMWAERVPDPPEEAFILIFSAAGGWLMVVYAAIFNAFSELLIPVLLYLLVVLPLLMLVMVAHLVPRFHLSAYHAGALLAGAAYLSAFGVLALSGLLLLAGGWVR